MSQTIISTVPDANGQWQTVTYSDGSRSYEPVPGSTVAVATANAQTLQGRAAQALAANATFIAQAKPSTAAAQASQAYDQAVKLSRQVNAIMRLLVVGDTSTITDS